MVVGRPASGVVIAPGSSIGAHHLDTVTGERIEVPDTRWLVHLQFRRFAGCPVCNLHLHSFSQRHEEIEAANIREVVVFHSSSEQLAKYANDLPFTMVPDPHKKLYKEFGVESSLRSLVDPRVWAYIVAGILRSLFEIVAKGYAVPTLKPEGGRLGLPADFLVSTDGKILALKYGKHAYDQWSVDELLALTQSPAAAP
jgi:peroxiredoxin